MTEQQAINKVIETANSQVGYREGENNYNKYAAELDPLKVTYGNKQNMAWCGEFVLWVFYKCFGIDKALEMLCSPNPTAIPLCKSGAQYFKSAGRWSKTPSLGAIVFFYVSGGINHQGIVTAINGKTITTDEGNSTDMVSRRNYTIGSSQIAGYGIPKWSVVAKNATGEPSEEIPVSDSENPNNSEIVVVDPDPQPTGPVSDPNTYDLTYTILRYGAGMAGQEHLREQVCSVQQRLRWMGYDIGPDGADGEYGDNTTNAVRQYQRSVGLQPDGEFGPLTRGRMDGLT